MRRSVEACREYLGDKLLLDLKPLPPVNRSEHGLDFLGRGIFPTHMTLGRRSRVRLRRRLAALERPFDDGLISEGELQ